jgi:hypothetical protein
MNNDFNECREVRLMGTSMQELSCRMAVYTFAGKIRAIFRVICFLRSIQRKLIFEVVYREVGNSCKTSFSVQRRVILHRDLGSAERLESVLLYAVCCERTPKVLLCPIVSIMYSMTLPQDSDSSVDQRFFGMGTSDDQQLLQSILGHRGDEVSLVPVFHRSLSC